MFSLRLWSFNSCCFQRDDKIKWAESKLDTTLYSTVRRIALPLTSKDPCLGYLTAEIRKSGKVERDSGWELWVGRRNWRRYDAASKNFILKDRYPRVRVSWISWMSTKKCLSFRFNTSYVATSFSNLSMALVTVPLFQLIRLSASSLRFDDEEI